MTLRIEPIAAMVAFLAAVVLANLAIRNHIDHPCVPVDTRAAIYHDAAIQQDAADWELDLLVIALGQECEE